MQQVDIRTFRAWVDCARAAKSLPTLNDYRQVHEALRSCFDGVAPQVNAFNLARTSVILHHYLSDGLQPYYEYSSTIGEALRGAQGGTARPEQWRAAMEVIAAHEEVLKRTSMSEESIFRVRAQEVEVGLACAYLKQHGFTLVIDDEARADMANEHCNRLGVEIDAIAKRVGGLNLLSAIFQGLDRGGMFDAEHGRWHLTRPGFQFGGEAEKAQAPWGYLYHLGIKHLAAPGVTGNAEIAKLIALARAGTAVMCVQPFNPFEGMHVDANGIVEYLMRSVVYDSLFTFSQVDERVAVELISHLAAHLKREESEEGGDALADAASVGSVILTLAKSRRTVSIKAKDVASTLKKSSVNFRGTLEECRLKVRKTLDAVFAHEGGVNTALSYPPRSTDMDASDRPLMRISDGVYLCPPRALAAKAVLQAMLDLADREVSHAGSQVGMLIEDFFIKAARSSGLQVVHGKYDLGKENGVQTQGDCDLVIQTDDVVVFLEVKKKGLNKTSRSGNERSDLSLLVDLAQSVVSSQFQALRHEALLRKHGKLMLRSADGETSEVVWNNQKVYRVSVSLFDTGSLQDRETLRRFLSIGCNIQVDHPDSMLQEEADTVNKLLTKLREQAIAVEEAGSPSPFDGSYQLSASQFLVHLRNSNSNESFVEELTRGTAIVNGKRDFYAHQKYVKTIFSVTGS